MLSTLKFDINCDRSFKSTTGWTKHFLWVNRLFGDEGRHDNNALLFWNCSLFVSLLQSEIQSQKSQKYLEIFSLFVCLRTLQILSAKWTYFLKAKIWNSLTHFHSNINWNSFLSVYFHIWEFKILMASFSKWSKIKKMQSFSAKILKIVLT